MKHQQRARSGHSFVAEAVGGREASRGRMRSSAEAPVLLDTDHRTNAPGSRGNRPRPSAILAGGRTGDDERGFVAEGARRAFCPSGLVAVAAALACSIAFAAARAPTASAASVQSRINALIRDAIARHGIRAVIFQATTNGRTIMTAAYGNSQTGVPATTNMHFRNGAVAIS